MKIEPFVASHLPMVNSWFEARGLNTWDLEDLPRVGYVVGDCAAAWLYQTDGAMALIENLIIDPNAEPHHAAASGMTVHTLLVEEARARGFKTIATLSQDHRIAHRFERRCNGSITRPYMLTTGLL